MARLNRHAIAAGVAAEKDAKWYIDRAFHGSGNYRVIHDVLLKDHRSESWCQIDHLVVGRLGQFLVLETKSSVEGISIHAENGAWSILYQGKPKPMKSPIEQNARHIEVLRAYLHDCDAMPRRLGIAIKPTFENWILVQPGARLPQEYGGARLVQRDHLQKEFERYADLFPVKEIFKLMSLEAMKSIVDFIIVESRKNKSIRDREAPPESQNSQAEAQGAAPPSSGQSQERRSLNKVATPCAECGSALSSKEVSFCRFNFTKLGRRYLCRSCQ